MIDKLTQHQEDLFVNYSDYCISRGLACDDINKEQIEKAISEMYRIADIKRPLFAYVRSPMDGIKFIASQNRHIIKWYDCYWGQHEYNWIAFYRYFTKAKLLTYDDNDEKSLSLWETLAETCGWWWPFEKVVVVSEKPSEIHLDETGNLHRDGGPAIAYRDGWSLWFLHGVSVPRELAETPFEKLRESDLARYTNAEQRAQFIRKFGVIRLESRGELINTLQDEGYENYNLIDMRNVLHIDTKAPYLFMTNHSTGERHAEGVVPDCKTVQQAINWRAGKITVDWMPVSLT